MEVSRVRHRLWCYYGVVERAVIDTNVLFEGATKQGSAAGLVVEAWLGGLFQPFVSTALAYEYVEVLSRRLSTRRWQEVKPLLAALFRKSHWSAVYFSWRPSSPDPADDLVVDCAMNSAAIVVTENRKDFRTPMRELGLPVASAAEFLELLVDPNRGDLR